jgi:uncharacterized membrane protein (DUF4010 family)
VTFDTTALWHLAVALLGGLAVGIERERTGHAVGPRARFAGIRTFTLLGLISGLSGWLYIQGLTGLSVILIAGVGALVVVAYASASRRDIDGTTEVAAFVVLTAGILAGLGLPRVASSIIALTVLLLIEKRQLHDWVAKLDRRDMRAGARFAVMAAVVLPLLPAGPFGPMDTIRPRMLWALVLFFSGISFVGFLARRVIGDRGFVITGALGGVVSSTSVTLTFSRLSRSTSSAGLALAAGTLAANVVVFPRLLIATAVLAPALTAQVWPAFVAPALIATALAVTGLWRSGQTKSEADDRNPLQFAAALQMAALFQVVLFGIAWATHTFGQTGVYSSAAVLGLADLDALSISLSQMVTGGLAAAVAARGLIIGVVANTAVKLSIALVIGRGTYRWLVAVGLALVGGALVAGMLL